MTGVRWSVARASGVIAASALLIAMNGCSSGAAKSTDATEKDFAITLGTDSLEAGDVTFNITNDGPSTHEFVVFRTDLAEDDLPLTKDENGNEIVDEEGDGVEHIDEVEDIEAGSDEDFDANLSAGKYVVICNLPDHYKAGMHAAFTVED